MLGGSTTSLFFALPVVWTFGRSNDVLIDVVFAVHFLGLMVASLFFHAMRTEVWWRADVAFTILTPFAFLCSEFLVLSEKGSWKMQAITALYAVVTLVTAFAWRFDESVPDKNQGLFQLLVGAVTGFAFLVMLILRLDKEKSKKKNILVTSGLALGILGLLLLIANLQKENENTVNWLYFCPNPFFSSLAVGHMVLAGAITCVCFTYNSKKSSLGYESLYAIDKLIF